MWVLPMEGERKPWRFLETNFNERGGRFSGRAEENRRAHHDPAELES
jgi:hypothetical protein